MRYPDSMRGPPDDARAGMAGPVRGDFAAAARSGPGSVHFRVNFLLVEGFSMMALSSAVEPLRAANRLLGCDRYSWSLVAETAGPVRASNGIEIRAERGVDQAVAADLSVVVASLIDPDYLAPRTFFWLRRLRAAGQFLGGISNGALVLARAGILHNTRVTVHWENAPLLAEQFPDVIVSRNIYCWDRGILTAAGGTAAMDMMLAVIMQIDGDDLAADVANQFLHGPIRPSTQGQTEDLRWRFRVTDSRLLTAIEIMKSTLTHPVRISAIAAQVGISERQLERLFTAELKRMPSEFYMGLRLRDANRMLLTSTETLEMIAERCGFSSLGHFSRAFKAQFGESPSITRRRRARGYDGFMQEDGGRT